MTDHDPHKLDRPFLESLGADGCRPPLATSVEAVCAIAIELKARLVQNIHANEALERDLAETNQRLADLLAERDSLLDRLAPLELEILSREDSRAELGQLRRERDEVFRRQEGLDRALQVSSQRITELGQCLDKIRRERDHAVDEATCIEAQFSRAMKVIEELRADFRGRERGPGGDQPEALERRLAQALAERDAAKATIKELHRALGAARHAG